MIFAEISPPEQHNMEFSGFLYTYLNVRQGDGFCCLPDLKKLLNAFLLSDIGLKIENRETVFFQKETSCIS